MKKEDRAKDKSYQKEDNDMTTETLIAPEKLEGKTKVSSKGQIVIPVEIRRAAGIKEGKQQELKVSYTDGQIIIEIEEYLSADELLGFFDTEEDKGNFELDLNQAREDRAEEILRKGL